MYRFLIIMFALLPLPAKAGIILTIERTGSSVDNPQFTVASTGGKSATRIAITLGDASFNFDSVQSLAQTGSFGISLLAPDDINNGERSDELAWDLTDFTAGSSFTAKIDIDRDVGSATVDWQTTLFNNGDLPNAALAVTWSDGTLSDVIFLDDPGRNPLTPYVLPVEAVPEAGSLLLSFMAASLCCFFLRKRRLAS